MRILVACEYSGTVRRAFAALGHKVMSCDLLPPEDNSPAHYQGDVFDLLGDGWYWDLMIAHPPCTFLTNAGVCHLYKDRKKENGFATERWDEMHKGAEFFRRLMAANVERICIENPIMHGHAKALIGKQQTQTIQPYMFGHLERKATCLWLKGLPELQPTNNVYGEMMKLPKNKRERLHYLSPGPDRWKERSRTYQGIADAMAAQWGNLCQ